MGISITDANYWLRFLLNSNIAFGGTSILILVAVAIETLRQVESRALMVTYDQYQQPDFFYDVDEPALAGTGARKLRMRDRFRSNKPDNTPTKAKSQKHQRKNKTVYRTGQTDLV